MKFMKMYEDVTMNYTTEEVAKMNSVKVDDPHVIIKLIELGFGYCIFRDEYYFLATPKLLKVMTLLKNNI